MTAATTTTTNTTTPADVPNPLDGGVAERLIEHVTVADLSSTTTITCPFTEEPIAEIPVGTEDDVKTAFAKARKAQESWKKVSPEARREVLHRFHDLLITHQSQVIDIVQAETGKSRSSAYEELIHTAITARYYGNQAEKMMRTKSRHGALPVISQTKVHYHPRGVIGVIAPWNYPLTLAVSDAIAALAAGNGIVLKPDSSTPFTALIAVELLFRAGLPRDLFQVVPGPGRTVGQEILQHADYLMFTGSSATGKALAAQAGERLIGFSAELGGKNALVVAEDANIQAAADGARVACFTNSGHLCVSIERMYIANAVWDDFVAAFTDRVRAMTLGAGYEWEVDMGCLQSRDQFDTVKEFVDNAREEGATVLCGGRARPDLGPLFYEPTVLTDVDPSADISCEEVFGPVVVLHRVDDVHEGIRRANDSHYGLNASLWTSPKRGQELGSQLHAGSVNVNDGFSATFASIDAPMGGWKDSGVGRRQGVEGLLKYCESQTVTVQRLFPLAMPFLSRQTYAKTMTTALTLGKKLRLLP
ncbi:succinate-semialdehyde dehydrogenase (NADP(+)) [Corynebacterium sp. TAE3-ERU12]|uniref:succinic semialdehyde dehydrogenase n=1 Tax=Corynebacterium sp. TAE3-ERU12 TaxID=2849491 RepID=UPI001C4746C2|nr:succinic semialdehyde dehydrogenase [Corynebacterium sp. TAE3-ERU12]MBV7295697.1 succinate-semialdehyde dehydrogenase (NADP(+)) [Corynebacterium sp. TAE3-ERU12]